MNTPKTSPDDLVHNQPESAAHGFGLGLLVGTFAGITAYYFWGTEKGQRLKDELIKEFEKAKVITPELAHKAINQAQSLSKEDISTKADNILDTIEHTMHDFVEELDHAPAKASPQASSKKTKKKKSSSARRFFSRKK